MSNFPKILRFHRNSIRLWLITACLILTTHSSPYFFAVGVVLTLTSGVFRLWAKGHLTQREYEDLTTSGPYASCRNPFYLGNLVLDIGISFMSGCPELLILYLPIWFFFHYRAIFSEEKTLENLYGEAFAKYKKTVPRLFPWRLALWRDSMRNSTFSWANPNITRRKEIPRFLVVISYPFLFFSWAEIKTEGFSFLINNYTVDLCILCIAIFLLLFSLALRIMIRKKTPLLPASFSSSHARIVFFLLTVFALFTIDFPEMEIDMIFPLGIITSVLLLFAYSHLFHRFHLFGELGCELIALVIICIMAELPWLAVVPLFYYSIIMAGQLVSEQKPNDSSWSTLRVARFSRFAIMLLIGISIVLLKEGVCDGNIVLTNILG